MVVEFIDKTARRRRWKGGGGGVYLESYTREEEVVVEFIDKTEGRRMRRRWNLLTRLI